jgi:hypothetical protein
VRVGGGAEQKHDAVSRARSLELLAGVPGADPAADNGRRRPRSRDLLPHLLVGVEGSRRERPDLDVVRAQQAGELGEHTRRHRHRAAAAQEGRADPVDEDRQAVLTQLRDRAEAGEEPVDHQCPRTRIDDRAGVCAGDVRRVEDVLRDRTVDRANTLWRRSLQLVVLDQHGAAGRELGGDHSRLLGRQSERGLDDRAHRDARLRGKRRPRHPLRPVHLDEPAGLDVAAIGPLAGDAGGEKLLGARLPVERGEGERHALAAHVDNPRPHPLRPVRQADRLQDRKRLAPGRRPDFENCAHPSYRRTLDAAEGGFRCQ